MSSEIDKVLNIAPAPEVIVETTVLAKVDSENDDTEHDFETARQNIIEILEQGKDIFSEMAGVAKQSQHPRAYEVLGNLMKIAVDTNKDLLNLRKQKKELMKKEDGSSPTTVNNNLVVSTADLLKMIKNQKDDN